MAFSRTQILGYIRRLIETIGREAKRLEARAIDAKGLKHDLEEKLEHTVAAIEAAEAAKRTSVRRTAEAREAVKDLYAFGSGAQDLVVHGFGKNSPEARIFRRLKTEMRRHERDGDGLRTERRKPHRGSRRRRP